MQPISIIPIRKRKCSQTEIELNFYLTSTRSVATQVLRSRNQNILNNVLHHLILSVVMSPATRVGVGQSLFLLILSMRLFLSGIPVAGRLPIRSEVSHTALFSLSTFDVDDRKKTIQFDDLETYLAIDTRTT